MNDYWQKFHHWLVNGTDRQLFYRSLILLMLLVGGLQVGVNTGHFLAYIFTFAIAVIYVYLWLELVKRFTDKNKNDKNDKDQ